MVADIGDPAVPLLVDDGLIGAAPLEIVVADELHVALFGLVLRQGLTGERDTERRKNADRPHKTLPHDSLLWLAFADLFYFLLAEGRALRLRPGAALCASFLGT